MMEHELRQREFQNELSFSPSALIPVLHPPAMAITPGLHCCPPSKDLTAAGASSYVPVYKYKPLYECDFQFYQFFHLRNRSSTSTGDDYNDFLSCQSSGESREDKEEQIRCKDQPELIDLASQQRLRYPDNAMPCVDIVKSPSKRAEIMDPSSVTHFISGSGQGGADVSSPSRTFELRPLTARGWSSDTPAAQAGPHVDSVKNPHGSSVRTPAVRPLPFSVEALLRA